MSRLCELSNFQNSTDLKKACDKLSKRYGWLGACKPSKGLCISDLYEILTFHWRFGKLSSVKDFDFESVGLKNQSNSKVATWSVVLQQCSGCSCLKTQGALDKKNYRLKIILTSSCHVWSDFLMWPYCVEWHNYLCWNYVEQSWEQEYSWVKPEATLFATWSFRGAHSRLQNLQSPGRAESSSSPV